MNSVMRASIFTIFSILLASVSIGQSKLNLVNGKVYEGKVVSETDLSLNFEEYKKNGKPLVHEYTKNRIFSVVTDGKERVVYRQDSIAGNTMSRNQVRMLMYGEQDAYKNFKTLKHFGIGFGTSLAISLYDTYEFSTYEYTCGNVARIMTPGAFKRSPSMVSVLSPLLVSVVTVMIKTRIHQHQVSDLTYLANEKYAEGFNRVKKSKRFFSVLKGSLAGVGVGLISYNAFKFEACE